MSVMNFMLACPVTWVLCPFKRQAPHTHSPHPIHWGKKGSLSLSLPAAFLKRQLSVSLHFSSSLSLSVPLFHSLLFHRLLLSQYLLNKPSITKIFMHGLSVCSLPTTMLHLSWDPPRVTSIINHNNEVQSFYIFQKQLKIEKTQMQESWEFAYTYHSVLV